MTDSMKLHNPFLISIDTYYKTRIYSSRFFIYDAINQLSCSVYRIQKAPGYDEEDLSTIRTITERIK